MPARRRIGLGAVAIGPAVALAFAAVMGTPLAARAARDAGGLPPGQEHACGPASAGEARCHAVRLLDPAAWSGSHVGQGPGPSRRPPTTTTTAPTTTLPPTTTTTAPTTTTLPPTTTTAAPTTTTTAPAGTPAGYAPADLQAAYNLATASASSGGTQTVAIVDAYDDPNVQADLATYRAQYGIKSCDGSGTVGAAGCLTKVDQNGGTSYPTPNSGWAQEISLDVDMVSAVCPNCHILLVEAATNGLSDLATAERYATAHANAVSNSYGAGEFSSETSFDSSYSHAGVAVTASAGDSGYRVEYPAASPFVVAVGGTTLNRNTTTARGWTETVWSGTGSGCSVYEANPGWQPVTALCGTRTVGDVSADADPNTGVAVYDTYSQPGWLVFGGTSVASPITAGIYALAGNASTFTTGTSGSTAAQGLYPGSALNKVTSGANAQRCSNYLCNAAFSLASAGGYNGPTGNGSPNGTTGF